MGCGCSGNSRGMKNTGKRPIVTPRQASVRVSTRSPSQIREEQLNKVKAKSTSGMSKERLVIEKKRRDAINRQKGKFN